MCVQVRIMFEVQDLKFATLATVSRCGMVWFSEDVLNLEMIFEHHLTRMRNISIDEAEDAGMRAGGASKSDVMSPALQVKGVVVVSCWYIAHSLYMYIQVYTCAYHSGS